MVRESITEFNINMHTHFSVFIYGNNLWAYHYLLAVCYAELIMIVWFLFSFWFDKSATLFPQNFGYWRWALCFMVVFLVFWFFFISSSGEINWFLGDVKHLKNCRAAELSMPYVHPGSSPLSLSIHVCKIFIYITNSNLSNLNSLFKYHKFLLFKIDIIVLSVYSL